jgi:hypothetical protein
MKKISVCLLLLTALTLSAADVTGKWTGSFDSVEPDGQTKSSTALLNLKQTGTEITGTLGPGEDHQMPIQNGKIEGDKIVLDVAPEEGLKMQFKLVVAGDRITGDASMSRDGQTRTAKLDLKRSK